jgi:hypothetical protein
MGKVINMNGEEVEVVNVDEARSFFRGRHGEIMKRRSFMQMIYRHGISQAAYTKTTKGNYWFNKKYLLGFYETPTAA